MKSLIPIAADYSGSNPPLVATPRPPGGGVAVVEGSETDDEALARHQPEEQGGHAQDDGYDREPPGAEHTEPGPHGTGGDVRAPAQKR